MWSHRQYTAPFTTQCSIFLFLLCYEVWVIHEQGLDPALGANSHQTGKEDWHWSHQSRCPRNYILYFTHFWHKLCNKCDCSIVSLYNVSGWSFFLGWLYSTGPILGSHTLSCQTVTRACSLHARKESSHVCLGLPWIQQSSIVWPFLFCFFFSLLQYILRRNRNFGLLRIICRVALDEDKQRQWSHVFMFCFWVHNESQELFGSYLAELRIPFAH